MKRLPYLLLCFVCVSAGCADSNVTFTGSDEVFGVVATAIGTVRTEGPFVIVSLDHFTLRTSDKFKNPAHVMGYRIGLVKNIAGGQWDVVRSSPTISTDYSLVPGQTQGIKGYQAEIPIDGLGSIKGDWLAIVVDVQISGPAGTVYAHSQNWHFP